MPPKTLHSERIQSILNEAWETLQRSLDKMAAAVRQGNVPPNRTMPDKMVCYSLVCGTAVKDRNLAQMLYEKLIEWIEADLDLNVAKPVHDLVQQRDSEALLCLISESFTHFKSICRNAQVVFRYLDQHLTNRQNHDKIDRLFLKCYHNVVFGKNENQVANAVIHVVNNGREGRRVDMAAVAGVVNTFNTVAVSSACSAEDGKRRCVEFEQCYLPALTEYVKTPPPSDGFALLQWAESLKFELWESIPTVTEMMATCFRHHQNQVILHRDSGFRRLLQEQNEADLKRMHHVFKHAPRHEATKFMAEELFNHIVELNTKMDHWASNSSVEILLMDVHDLLHKHLLIILNLFEGSDHFKAALTKAVNKVMHAKLDVSRATVHENPVENNVSGMLATYLDSVMRGKVITDFDEALTHLDKLCLVFAYLEEKDVFQQYCKAKLARRLLQTTPDEELEKALLERFRRHMGRPFTHQMEGMLRDGESTKQIAQRFQDDSSSKQLGKVDFNMQILTASHWPAFKTKDTLDPCTSLCTCIIAFTHFYKKIYATRMLNWVHTLGSATMSVSFPKGTKEVTGSTHRHALDCCLDQGVSCAFALQRGRGAAGAR